VLERDLGVDARARGNEVRLVGDADKVELARKVLEELYGVVRSGGEVRTRDVRQAVRMVTEEPDVNLGEVYEDILSSVGGRRQIKAKNLNQRRYIEAMRKSDVVFAVGPAGTGKTYLAMAMAIAALNRHEVSRVVLTRPAVEAGEKLGFLPGSMADKVDPYLRPLYDALNEMMPFEKSSRLMFVILDEAQNTTHEQMKMLLTRLGFDSKAVITGDVTQIDLPAEKRSGLVDATNILEGVEGIDFLYFSEKDVVRHPLVQSIIVAYERHEADFPNGRADGAPRQRAARKVTDAEGE